MVVSQTASPEELFSSFRDECTQWMLTPTVGCRANSDLVWQAFIGLGYRITENASLTVGYRG